MLPSCVSLEMPVSSATGLLPAKFFIVLRIKLISFYETTKSWGKHIFRFNFCCFVFLCVYCCKSLHSCSISCFVSSLYMGFIDTTPRYNQMWFKRGGTRIWPCFNILTHVFFFRVLVHHTVSIAWISKNDYSRTFVFLSGTFKNMLEAKFNPRN